MAKDYAKSFYKSKRWLSCRASYIADRVMIDGGMCQHCRERLGSDVDHIEELNEMSISDPEISLNHDNLQYLCKVCHNRKTKRGQPEYYFDEVGRLIRID